MAMAAQDCAVLFQAFTSLNAATAGGDCCGVTGITCENGRVVRIALASSNLEGVLPDFSKLTELVDLRLEVNLLSGRIPTSIGALTKLTIIDIGNNGFTGDIPSSISQMSALQELYIGFNRLTGEIPSSLSSMASHLRVINMAGNQLMGSLPTSYGALTLLTELELQNNLLTGPIPSEYGSFTQMSDLRLSGNQLTGSIPDELLLLPTTGVLYVLSCDMYLEFSMTDVFFGLYRYFQENNLSGPLSPAWNARKSFNGSSNCFDGQTGSNRNPTCDTLPETKTSSSIPSQTGSIVPSTKPSSPANGSSLSTDSSSSSSNGGLIGGVVGGVLALLLLAGLAYWWFKRSKDAEKKAEISSSTNPSSSPSNANPLNSSSTTNTRDIESEQIEIFSAHGSASNPDTTTTGATSSNINSTDFLTTNAARLEEQASSKEKKNNMAPGLLDVYSSSSAATGGSLASANSSMDLKQLKKESETMHASQWTTEDVCVWAVRALPGIGKTVAVKVMEHGVDGAMLFKLTNEHLRDDLGLVKLQDRMAFLDALARLKGDVDESVAVGPPGPPVYTP
ncbi:hypothetical protein CcCBS67573_g07683 [Chytriomyces confervae]|uniref:SAM domain-containing protein n=1 Tax=Chytriomyces confervae TaxID=246404 RepID=A0A507EU81_9FUNG|nr:hypothetical protein CcCBS67573_g07683 [Chytriomyces confervae]